MDRAVVRLRRERDTPPPSPVGHLSGRGAAAADASAVRMTPTIEADDSVLVARCIAGDGGAWTTLVHRYKRLVYAVARRARLEDAAVADVFQTVFARLIEHLPHLRQPERLHAWIVTTAKREAVLQAQRSQRTVSLTRPDDDESSPDEPADESLLPDVALIELQEANLVRNALDRLDGRCRDLLLLLFRDDDSPYEEVSQRMGMPIGSIGPTRSRCLEKIRALLAGHVSRGSRPPL